MAKKSKKAAAPKRDRSERRFEPRSTHNPILVQAIGGVGAAALGAGVYGQFLRPSSVTTEPLAFAPWVLAAGAVVLGIGIWLGTSGEPALRVGDAGVGTEKGSLRYIPWHGIESIRFERGVLTVRGNDDTQAALAIATSSKSQPQAIAWIVKEGRARVPSVVEVDDQDIAEAHSDAGEISALEPLQVVGKRCAESGKIIAYEPDARICHACERVYHKEHVPETCACGASLVALRPKKTSAKKEATSSDDVSRA